MSGGSAESASIQQNVRAVTSPPGEKYNFTRLAEAVQALQAGEDIDFEGVSGPLDLGPEGDPTTSLYDVFQYQDGRLAVQRQIDVQR
jgi:branched-chain amino acid transport system substrate-binding protein